MLLRSPNTKLRTQGPEHKVELHPSSSKLGYTSVKAILSSLQVGTRLGQSQVVGSAHPLHIHTSTLGPLSPPRRADAQALAHCSWHCLRFFAALASDRPRKSLVLSTRTSGTGNGCSPLAHSLTLTLPWQGEAWQGEVGGALGSQQDLQEYPAGGRQAAAAGKRLLWGRELKHHRVPAPPSVPSVLN
jgi:hypothetical protein